MNSNLQIPGPGEKSVGARSNVFLRPQLVRLLCLMCGGLACAASAANLLQNPNFEEHDELFQLPPWQVTGGPHGDAAGPVIKPSAFGDIVLQLDQDPSGQNWTTPQMLANQTIDLPPSTAPTRLLLSAQLARDPAHLGFADAVGFAFFANTSGGPTLLPFEMDPAAVPADGDFHPVLARLTLPPDVVPGNSSLVIVKQQDGRFWIDGLDLEAEPVSFQLNPDRAPGDQPVAVQIAGPALGPGANVFFDNMPVEIADAQPGSVTVFAPPHPPGLVDVRIVPQSGPEQTESAAFLYLAPLTVTNLDPQIVSTAGGTMVHLQGSGLAQNTQIPHRWQPDTLDAAIVFHRGRDVRQSAVACRAAQRGLDQFRWPLDHRQPTAHGRLSTAS